LFCLCTRTVHWICIMSLFIKCDCCNQIWTWVDYSCASNSMFHLTLLAYDRFQAINQPLKYSSPNKMRWIGVHIALAYVICYATWLPLVLSQVSSGPYNLDCIFNSTTFTTILTIFTYLVPVLLMTYMYTRCVITLRRQFLKLHPVVVRVLPDSDQSTSSGPIETRWSRFLKGFRRISARNVHPENDNSIWSKIFLNK